MSLRITNEGPTGGEVQLTAAEWAALRPLVETIRNGPPVVEAVEARLRRDGLPFRVWLPSRQLAALEEAEARR